MKNNIKRFIKKKRLLNLLLLLSVLWCYNSACKIYSYSSNTQNVNLGLIITTATKYDSSILWFDSDLKLDHRQSLEYAMLGTPFYTPVENNNKLFVIPQGLIDKKDTRKVISIDKSTLAIEEYPFSNIGLNHMASIGDNVYAVNTLNGDSYLESYNTKTGKSKTVIIEKTYMETIIAAGGKLFCFTSEPDSKNPERYSIALNIYSPKLQLEKKIDISDFGNPTRKYCEDQDYLYITVNLDAYDQPAGKILRINKSNYQITEYATDGIYPNDIFIYGDKFIVTYYNPVQRMGSQISIWSPTEEEKIFDLGTELALTGLTENGFVVANDEAIRLYSLSDFSLIKETKLNVKSNYYVSNLLFLK